MFFILSTPVLIRHLWQLKTVVFLHWCLICTVPLAAAKKKKKETLINALEHVVLVAGM